VNRNAHDPVSTPREKEFKREDESACLSQNSSNVRVGIEGLVCTDRWVDGKYNDERGHCDDGARGVHGSCGKKAAVASKLGRGRQGNARSV
jgi:hypothetical protein